MLLGAVLKHKGYAIVSVTAKTKVTEIADIISTRRIGAVVVLDETGSLEGIVSERDVVKALSAHRGAILDMTADQLMTREVKTATPETSVEQAMQMMDAGYFRHLPVLEDGKLAGIISIRDVVQARLMVQEQEVDSLKSYVARAGSY